VRTKNENTSERKTGGWVSANRTISEGSTISRRGWREKRMTWGGVKKAGQVGSSRRKMGAVFWGGEIKKTKSARTKSERRENGVRGKKRKKKKGNF